MRDRRKLLAEGAWVAIGQLASVLAGVALLRVMTQFLDPQEYGQISILLGFVALALAFASTPYLQAAMRFRAEMLDQASVMGLKQATSDTIRPLLFLSAAVLMLLAWLMYAASAAWLGIGLLMSLLLILESWRALETSLLNSARRQRATAAWVVADSSSRPIGVFLAISIFGIGVWQALFGLALAILTANLVSSRLIALEGGGFQGDIVHDLTSRSQRTDLLRRIRQYALPIVPLAAVAWVNGLGDRYLVAGMMGFEQAGIYAAAYGLVSRAFLALGSFLDSWLRPYLFEAVALKSRQSLFRVLRLWISLSLGFGMIGVVIFGALDGIIAKLVLGPEFSSASRLMVLIAAGYLMVNLSQIAIRACHAFGITGKAMIAETISAFVGLAVTIPAVSVFGLLGAAYSIPVYFGVQLLAAACFARGGFVQSGI